MIRFLVGLTKPAVVVVVMVWAIGLLYPSESSGVDLARHVMIADTYYNYYVPPVGPYSVGAKLYPCPRPTPPLVGHTYVTYEPLFPHEFLYKHHRRYVTQHVDAPKTRTHVRWR